MGRHIAKTPTKVFFLPTGPRSEGVYCGVVKREKWPGALFALKQGGLTQIPYSTQVADQWGKNDWEEF